MCPLRWRIKQKSLSFIWCMSQAVSHIVFCWLFFLYCVFINSVSLAERICLREGEYPLVTRVLYGPCEKISKIFITEADLGEEVTYDVSVDLVPAISLSCYFLCHRHAVTQWAHDRINLTNCGQISCFGTDKMMDCTLWPCWVTWIKKGLSLNTSSGRNHCVICLFWNIPVVSASTKLQWTKTDACVGQLHVL